MRVAEHGLSSCGGRVRRRASRRRAEPRQLATSDAAEVTSVLHSQFRRETIRPQQSMSTSRTSSAPERASHDVHVGFGVVEMEGHSHRAGADRGRLMPAARSRSRPPSVATVTTAESPSGSPSRRRSAFASPTSWRWIAVIPTSPSISSAGTVPAQDSHAGEMSSRRASFAESQRRSVDRCPRIVAGIPAGVQRPYHVQALRPHHAEGRPAR